jgi:hypothetical protein
MPIKVDKKNQITKVGDTVYSETKKLRLRIKKTGRSAKLYLRYLSPLEISKSEPATSN